MNYSVEELRMISMAAPVWLKMLKTREDRVISKMYGEFRNGKVDHLCSLAELACVRDQMHEINAALSQLSNYKE